MGVKVNESPDNPFLIAGYALWIAFRFCIFVLWTQYFFGLKFSPNVVNCFQILYIRSLNTMMSLDVRITSWLWIAFRFCIFVLWTQSRAETSRVISCCELLSDFVYSFFEHNYRTATRRRRYVVNCFQILYIRSLNTIIPENARTRRKLWIAFRFCIFVLWTQYNGKHRHNCGRCELLSDFVYSFFEHNREDAEQLRVQVVNCFQILYIRSLNTIDEFSGLCYL